MERYRALKIEAEENYGYGDSTILQYFKRVLPTIQILPVTIELWKDEVLFRPKQAECYFSKPSCLQYSIERLKDSFSCCSSCFAGFVGASNNRQTVVHLVDADAETRPQQRLRHVSAMKLGALWCSCSNHRDYLLPHWRFHPVLSVSLLYALYAMRSALSVISMRRASGRTTILSLPSI
ncbi:hypothetical protein TcWFU_010532 [Taenia crassiceps]|uniref:Uncharacterized protein n=1 Tax=Taenia crassiceps TaxID=6207 RepID=A0ABR4QCA4_9CEST